ncbi:MAG: replicative DNA helicase [Oscillospiraceae bacterium]|jgi:replicative DNA helicase|nr:replicative DNA helicase [Oscillospiraceae bacterium]
MQGAPLPPHNEDAERSVLGAMLQDPEAVLLAQELLTPEAFYQPAHRELFDAMRALARQGRPVDLVTTDEELSRRGTLEGIGGTQYLVQLTQYVPTTANARAYIDIVDEKFTLRRLIEAGNDIQRRSYAQDAPLEALLSAAEKQVFDISMRRSGADTLVHIRDVLTDTYARIETLSRLKGQIDGVPTGFLDLDRLLTGLHGGELVLVGARPSMGKTSFAVNVAQHAAMHAGKTCALFSLEMPRQQIAMRMLCTAAKVDMQAVRHGDIDDDGWMRLTTALGPLAAANLYLDDTAGLTPTQLRSRCRRLMAERGLDLIVIDYMQLMTTDRRTENRQNEVSEISRMLKGIAMELNIPLIACAQLSRANAQRADKRPILSDLRDSGSIEQDADVVMFLHREEYYNPDTEDKNIAEVIVQKQRNGPLGTIKLAWLGQYTEFRNLAQG